MLSRLRYLSKFGSCRAAQVSRLLITRLPRHNTHFWSKYSFSYGPFKLAGDINNIKEQEYAFGTPVQSTVLDSCICLAR